MKSQQARYINHQVQHTQHQKIIHNPSLQPQTLKQIRIIDQNIVDMRIQQYNIPDRVIANQYEYPDISNGQEHQTHHRHSLVLIPNLIRTHH